ncbi:MAG TPA: response regulator [Verrucomicrobiae bacterium]|nr:response regulator [Verrucomicrobiae bacterium]
MKTLLFVDDEPRVLQGLQRQLHGMRNEWQMEYLDAGAKALEHMASHPVDVIVTDMMMPGMDGAQLLTEVMKRHPNTVRIVLSGHADRESVLRLVGPAHQYLSKPCEWDELRIAISRAFALRELLTNDKLKALATRTRSLPALPELHNQLTGELRKEEPSIERIGEIISKDIGMTSKMLQLVNSAFFGLPQPISSAAEAVAYLGLATVRALVLSLQVFSQYEQKNIKGFSIDALAQHSWMTGGWARRIAETERCDPKISDQCFLAGLLHDIGQLILASGLPDEYAQVLENTRSPGKSLWAAEQDQFGTTHAEVGAYLLGLWSLPNPVIEAVALHHRPASAATGKFSPVIAVHVANALTHEKSGEAACAGNDLDLNCLATIGLGSRVPIWREKCFEEDL